MNSKPVWISGLIVLLLSMLCTISSVYAQTPPAPVKVIAVYEDKIKQTKEQWAACPLTPVKLTLEVWNLGSQGGKEYADGTLTFEFPQGMCGIDDNGVGYLSGKPIVRSLTGVFSGGLDGVFTFVNSDSGQEGKVVFVDGTSAQLLMPWEPVWDLAVLTVTNPEAFITVTPTPAPGPCSPVISGYSGLKPGDTLSPAVDFIGPDGKAVVPLSSVIYINGQQASSVVWDGKAATITIQYTCPDHSANEQSVTVPAYVDVTPEAGNQPVPNNQPAPNNPPPSNNQPAAPVPPVPQNTNDGNSNGLVKTVTTAAGAVAGVLGTIGAVVSGGLAVSQMVKPGIPPNATRPGQPAVPQPAQPEAQKQSLPRKKLTPEERINLENIRSAMQSQMNEDRTQYNQITAQRSVLVGHLKRNLLKVFMKSANEVREWITLNPIEYGTNLGMKPVWDRVYANENGLSDSRIILRINSVVNEYDGKLHEIRKDVIHLKNEIEQINLKLAGQ